jgi:hypothetical protein
MGQHAAQDLHAIVGRARRVGEALAPLPNDRPDFLRAIELGDAQLAEILGDAVEPGRPVVLGRPSNDV